MANFFYANNVSFLISNSACFAELVEALKRAKSCPGLPSRQAHSALPRRSSWRGTPLDYPIAATSLLLQLDYS